jgi:long-chain acyl-CoA synthetase
LIAEAVARVNESLPAVARIRGFALFDKELDADDDELTRTQKVRRTTIRAKYRDDDRRPLRADRDAPLRAGI